MERLNVAIIGQGRSGKGIHGRYFLSAQNQYYKVKYVVETDEHRRNVAKETYTDCTVLSDYTELFHKTDINLVVNATYSDLHYSITKSLLEHNFNVLVEKPFARDYEECQTLINIATEHKKVLAVFQQAFFAPYYKKALEIIASKKLGKIEQISIRFNNFCRRWDWQTLQKRLGGNLYNTGPHPIGMAMGFLGFDKNISVLYSKLDSSCLFSGDADSYCKILLSAPDKPLVDIEVNHTDAFHNYVIKIQGTNGTFQTNAEAFKVKYIIDGENPKRPVCETFISDENNNPCYCTEKLIFHEEDGKYDGTVFNVATMEFYEDLYFNITQKRELRITTAIITQLMKIIEQVHKDNPLQKKY